MAIKERKQITGTTAQINGFAGHEGVLAFDKDTKHLHVLSGKAGQSTKIANVGDIPNVSGLATKKELEKYLPLTGGTLTGDLRNALGRMYVNDTSSSGGFKEFMLTANNGGTLALRTNDSPRDAGSFVLLPSDPVSGASDYYLLGLPNGDLLWGLQHIERVASKSDTWIRYENGLQVCWRNDYYSTKNQTITFPVPFSTLAPACVLNGANICWTSNWEATAMHVQTNASEIGYISWVAIGVWK